MADLKNRRFWVIELWNGMNKLFESKTIYGQITENNIRSLLSALVAKHGLTDSEIIGCYAKRHTKIYNDALVPTRIRGGKKYGYTCGDSIHAVAYVEDAQ